MGRRVAPLAGARFPHVKWTHVKWTHVKWTHVNRTSRGQTGPREGGNPTPLIR